MDFWRWNSGLSSSEIREQVVLGLFARSNQQAAGPTCSVFPEAQRLERRWQPDRRLGESEPMQADLERRGPIQRRRYGEQAG
jgi:hypothetical protein